MAYRIAVVDDNEKDAVFTHQILQSWAKARQIEIRAEVHLPDGTVLPLRAAEPGDYSVYITSRE